MKNLFFILIILFLTGCSNDNEKRLNFDVKDIQLTNLEGISSDFEFESSLNGNNLNCRIKTKHIKKDDSINSIYAYIENKVLTIYIFSTPNDFDCITNDCFTVHDLKFTIIGIKKGEYPVNIYVNSVNTNPNHYLVSYT